METHCVEFKGKLYYVENKKGKNTLSLIELEIEDISEIIGLDKLHNLDVLRLQYNNIKEIKGLDKLVNLKILELHENQIEEIQGLENLIQLKTLNLWNNPVYNWAKEQFGGVKFLTGEFKKPQNLVKYCQDKLSMSQPVSRIIPAKEEIQTYINSRIDEKKQLEKFKSILEMSQEIKKSDVAKSLGLDESELFEKLLSWKKTIPFLIKGDLIIVRDLSNFIGKIDEKFDNWDSEKQDNSHETIVIPVSDELKQEIQNTFEDEQKIRMVFIIHKESGGMLVNQFYGFDNLDDKSDLITGFLTTISQWGKEINKSTDEFGLNMISWNNFTIQIEQGSLVLVAVISDAPLISKETKNRIKSLIQKTEYTYKKDLERFSGNTSPFKSIEPLIKDSLKASHQFPFQLNTDSLNNSSFSSGVKNYFHVQSYKKDSFFLMDLAKDFVHENIVSKEIDAFYLLKQMIDEKILFQD